MKKTGLIVNLLLIFFYYSCAQDSSTTKYSIGNLTVKVQSVCYDTCDTAITFINVHENEKTSVEAAKEFLKEFGGNLVVFKHKGERNLTFKSNGQKFSVDPNRIYTDSGRKASLELLSTYKKNAAIQVQRFADEILKNFIDNKSLIVALHNNTDSNYSIISYTRVELEAGNAEQVYINDAMDPDDFILTTDTLIFEFLKQQEINAVLQSKNAADGGSLSVYAELNNIPYINVEAEHRHVEEQTRMLKALKDAIQQYRIPRELENQYQDH